MSSSVLYHRIEIDLGKKNNVAVTLHCVWKQGSLHLSCCVCWMTFWEWVTSSYTIYSFVLIDRCACVYVFSIGRITNHSIIFITIITGDPLHSRAACTQPCNVNTHSRAHCSPGARLCEQWGHGCVNNGARLCASARLCRGSPVIMDILCESFYRTPEAPIY